LRSGAAVWALALSTLTPIDAPAEKPADGEPPARQGTSSLSADLLASLDYLRAQVEKLRGLPFLTSVRSAEMSRRGVRSYMKELIAEEYPADELPAEEATLRYFGLIDERHDLEPMLLDLLEEQVAGVYDPQRKTLYVVKGPVMGSAALVHELFHALMDQHFDLVRLQEAVRQDDDRALALSCLLEGEATMAMSLWALQSGLDPNTPALLGGDTESALEAAQKGLSSVPVYVRETLLLPYLGGATWASGIMKSGGGLKALDAYFREPPQSTEQILHPARSMPPRDVPSTIDRALLAPGLPAGTSTLKRNQMGEFTLRLLLGPPGDAAAGKAADGWDGDLYELAERDGAKILAWITAWDAEEEAVEFQEAIGAWGRRRAEARGGTGSASFAAERRGRVVAVAEGSDALERARSLAERAAAGIEWR
jgi:hypothetical protein